MNKDKHIEGLEELYAACIAESRYLEEKERRHYKEDYRPLPLPSPSSDELKIKYPIAALFLKAESYTESWLPAEAYNN